MPDTKPNFFAFGQWRGVYLRVSAFNLWRFLQHLTSDLNFAEQTLSVWGGEWDSNTSKIEGGASRSKFRGCQSKDIFRGCQLRNQPVILFSLIFTPVAPCSSCTWLIFGMEVSRPLLQLGMKKVIILLYYITYIILYHFILYCITLFYIVLYYIILLYYIYLVVNLSFAMQHSRPLLHLGMKKVIVI